MKFTEKLIVDEDFRLDIHLKIFQYRNKGHFKSLSVKNIKSCAVYADLSFINDENVKEHIDTYVGRIPLISDLSELIKMTSDSGTFLIIHFEDENGELKFYRKKYDKEDNEQYKIAWLINKLIDEESVLLNTSTPSLQSNG